LVSKAESHKPDDDARVKEIETQNKATQLIAEAEGHLKTGPNDKLSRAIAALGLALESRDHDAIGERTLGLQGLLPQQAMDFNDIFADIFNATRKTQTSSAKPKPPSPGFAVTRKGTANALGAIFGSGEFTLDPQLCFVLMPFDLKLAPIYSDHIRPTVEGKGIRCQRADEIMGVGQITKDIWERINRARFIIADLTQQNSNVFYELGLAHALSKDVILLTQTMECVPFDLKSIRCIVYKYTPPGMNEFQRKLSETIDAVMKSR
jgi:hypothetical protein